MKKQITLIISFIVVNLSLFSQGNYNMGTTRNVTNGCGSFVFDNGGSTGNYGANRNDTITIFSNDPTNNPAIQIKIMEHYLSCYCDSTSLTIYLWLHFFKPNIAAPIEQQTI